MVESEICVGCGCVFVYVVDVVVFGGLYFDFVVFYD